MKPNRIIIFLISLVVISQASGQDLKANLSVDLDAYQFLVINKLEGKTTLIRSATKEMTIQSENRIEGEIWGWRSPKKRPSFEISTRESGDTLFIEMPEIFSYQSVGISTYSENISNILRIPEFVSIIIHHAEVLSVESEFNRLDIRNTTQLNLPSLSKRSISRLLCRSDNMIDLNGIKRTNSFEMHGIGDSTYYLEGSQITLNIK